MSAQQHSFYPNERAQNLERLRNQMEQCRAIYEGAKEEYERAQERVQKSGVLPLDPGPTQALRIYLYTREAYKRAVEEYNHALLASRLD